MKKIAGIIIKILLGIILLILVLLFTVPILFKEKIRTKVEQVISGSVNANVKFEDYKLGFFRNFPNLSFSLNGVSVVGIDEFKNDTLAGFKSFNLVFNLSSLFKKTGYEVKSIIVDRAVVNAIVLKNGKTNWDIMKDTTTAQTPAPKTTPATGSSSSGMKILLKKVALLNSSISYVDASSAMKAYLKNINFNLKGDMTMSETDMVLTINIGELTIIMDGMKYLNKVVVDSKIDMLANLDNMKFTFRDNYFSINDLKLNFSGMVAMPKNDIETDIKFGTAQTSFKTLLSLVPVVYMKDYKDLRASGEFALSGSAKGVYSSADSTLPDITLALSVNNGLISYPALPEQIKNINIKTNVFVNGKNIDKTTVGVDLFHMELAGSPFDMTFALKTPMSDPDFKGSMVGRIDLSALSKAVPMDSISLSGIIDMSVQMAGKMSMITKAQYDSFKASGTMNIKNMMVAMIGYPEVKINTAGFEFTPAYASMSNTSLNVGGKSDFALNGRIENYIPYVFSNKTIKGNLSLRSKLTDVSEIMAKMSTDTATTVTDTTSLTLIQVPKNIDFDFDALIDEFSYDNIKAQKVKGHIIVRNGILSIREAGMNILNGTISMNADYDTRDTLNPVMKADFDVQNIAVKDAFNTYNTVQKLAPAAKGIDGKINAKMAYASLLGRDMMPIINSINGAGKIHSDQITLLESVTFDKMKAILKLGDKYSNTFKDVNISFKIADGRIFVTPFDVRTGNLKMNIGGDQGLDQTLNYLVKTEIPRSDLGSSVNSLIDNLSAQASAFGINYKPSEILKVNLKVTGTFTKPEVSPFFGSTTGESSGGVKETVKEVVKQTIDNTVDKAKEKAKAEAEIQGARLVKEAEDRGQQLRDEAAKAAENIRKEADVQAQNLIDGSATKGTFAKMAAQKGADALRKTADKKATQLVQEADVQAKKLVEEAKTKRDEMINKI
ncbi:MAG: AsmA family protein [Bacteroidetes bacterium]|nr:MAG: AsmA family protein [Bacteroidota bacterium]